ncbi:MAG: serine/threonine protein kinase [Myxococcaceae bacterium]|nr:serine/threonine protein kinase [Myxococcaceae bacterium]
MSGTESEIITCEPHAPRHGDLVGAWRVLERMDSGSFGIVYKVALASEPSRTCAMKMASKAGDPRFEREADLQSLVDSLYLPRFLDAGEWVSPRGERFPYIVMELVEGVPLYEWARTTGRRLTSRRVLQLLANLARGLEEVHHHGLHRDVKGGNVLVRGDGTAVLLDLGACWIRDARTLTVGSLPPGTPIYRSPEAVAFRERFWNDCEARYESRQQDDLYALGVTAYRLTTGKYPPEAGSSAKLLPPSALCRLDSGLEALILRMLSPEREARGTAAQLAEALEAAAASTRKSLDEPLRPSRSVLPTEPTRFRGERGWWLRVAALPAAAVGLTALGALVLALHPPGEHVEPLLPYLATEEEVAQLFSADAGVAEQAVASVHEVPVAGFPSFTLAKPMPKEPLPKQRRPPCEPRVERAIHGGCWVPVGDEKPPCGPKMYDYEGRCYLASYNAPRQPTSERP